MHASSTASRLAFKFGGLAEAPTSMLVRYLVCTAVFSLVALGATIDGIVPMLPMELATILG